MKTGPRHGKGSNPHPPVQVNMAAWYRYRQGIINTNGGVSTWKDMTNQGRDLVQASAASRPTLLSDGTLSFDGSNDALAVAFTLIQPFTIYLLFQQVSFTVGDVLLDGSTGTTKLSQVTGSPALAMNGGSALANSSTALIGSWAAAAMVFNSTTSVYQVGGGAAPVTTSGDANTNNAGGLTLGSDRSAANFANILVREVMIYSVAHDAQTRVWTLRYLQGVGGSLGGV